MATKELSEKGLRCMQCKVETNRIYKESECSKCAHQQV